MAQLWKYITELNVTNEAYEESDQIFVNQGGRSVQIPWSILKAGIENRLANIDNLLDRAVFVGEDSEEGYIEADVTLDAIRQDVNLLKESIVNLTNAVEQITSALTDINRKYTSLEHTVKEQGVAITTINNKVDKIPRIMSGDVNPNSIIEELAPNENDIFILYSLNA